MYRIGAHNAEWQQPQHKISIIPQNEKLLLEMWKDRIQDLYGVNTKSLVYQEMSTKLYRKYNVSISAEEIKDRINELTSKYLQEKELLGTGKKRLSTWKLYPHVHAIIGSRGRVAIRNSPEGTLNQLLEETTTLSLKRSPSSSPAPSYASAFEWPSHTNEDSTMETENGYTFDDEQKRATVSNLSNYADNSMHRAKRAYKKKFIWTPSYECALLELWQENTGEMGKKRNLEVYKNMAKVLRSENINVSDREIRFKVHNLTNKYRREKKLKEKTGVPSSWPFFKQLESILRATNQAKKPTNDQGKDETNASSDLSASDSDGLLEPMLADEDLLPALSLKTSSHNSKRGSQANPSDPPSIPRTSRSCSPESITSVKPSNRSWQQKKRNLDASETRINSEFLGKLLDEYKSCTEKIDSCLKRIKESDETLLTLETRKLDLLEVQTRDGTELKNALLSYLRDQQSAK